MAIGAGGWSYYGAAHRYDVHADGEQERVCAETMRRLRRAGAEEELRSRAADGDRCAFIALVEILVDEDRTDDLRAMADAGDGRAASTLMEMLDHQDREQELRGEVAAGRAGIGWLLSHLSRHGRVDDALAELAGWVSEHPEDVDRSRARRYDLLLAHGRVAEVRRAAEAGDRTAARRLRGLHEQPESAG